MQTWATQLHPYVWASHRHFQLAPEDAGRASSSGATWKKDMYKHVFLHHLCNNKGLLAMGVKDVHDQQLFVQWLDKYGCWGKWFCRAPFCGEHCVLTIHNIVLVLGYGTFAYDLVGNPILQICWEIWNLGKGFVVENGWQADLLEMEAGIHYWRWIIAGESLLEMNYWRWIIIGDELLEIK